MKIAKRGDLAVLMVVHRDYVIGQPLVERITFDVGVVTNITRDGVAKAVRLAWQSDDARPTSLERMHGLHEVLIASADTVDVAAAIATARSHVWEGHATVKPYDTLDEVCEAMTAHRIPKGSGAGNG